MKKGYKHSLETKLKMSKSARTRIMPPQTEEHKKKLSESNKKTWSDPVLLKRHSENTKIALRNMPIEDKKRQIEKIILSCSKSEIVLQRRNTMLRLRNDPKWLKKSQDNQNKIEKNGEKNPFYHKKHTVQSRKKISISKKLSPLTKRGKDNSAWIDGKGNIRKGERLVFEQTLEYRLFRENVFERDNYTCVLCGNQGGKLSVDHIKSYRNYPKLRIDINNGRTLCWECHKTTPNFGRKKDYETII